MYLYLLKVILSFDTYKYFTIISENNELLNILNLINENGIINDKHFFDLLINLFISHMSNSFIELEKIAASELLEVTEKIKIIINISRKNLLKNRGLSIDSENINNKDRRFNNDWCWDTLIIKEFDQNFQNYF